MTDQSQRGTPPSEPRTSPEVPGQEERIRARQKKTIGAQFPEHQQDTGEYPERPGQKGDL